MKLLSHAAFGRLRLDQFLTDVTLLSEWEYLGHEWRGQASGFTTTLQLDADPGVTRAVEIDLTDLPEPAAGALLSALGLPLVRGMRPTDLTRLIGPPRDTFTRMPDRATHEFDIAPPSYHLTCTVSNSQGLVFVAIHAPLPTQGE